MHQKSLPNTTALSFPPGSWQPPILQSHLHLPRLSGVSCLAVSAAAIHKQSSPTLLQTVKHTFALVKHMPQPPGVSCLAV